MPLKNTIQVFEHQKLYYSTEGPFQEIHWKALARYAEQVNEEYYVLLGKGVKFKNYVGVIQAGNLTIEILPKADISEQVALNKVSDLRDKDKNVWHNVLIDMLRECRLLQAEHSNKAFLKFKSYSLLDIYLELFLAEAEQLFHEGLIKKYQKEESNQLALKGQLLFGKNVRHNLVHKERFYVRHTVYNHQNIFNQLIYKTLLLIPNISNSHFVIDKVNRLLFSFPELADIKVNENTFSRISFDRKTERYKDALMISKMILLNYHPDISGGSENVVAILFDMNKLWEEFVYRRLKKEELNYYVNVLPQQSKPFWTPSHMTYSKKVRPDILINYKFNEVEHNIILDTKWKNVQNLTPSDDDLKQMFIYNLLWKCTKSILLYPSTNPASGAGNYLYKRTYVEGNICALETISVLNELQTKLNEKLGVLLLRQILGDKISESLKILN